jgi:hypothetical protein
VIRLGPAFHPFVSTQEHSHANRFELRLLTDCALSTNDKV